MWIFSVDNSDELLDQMTDEEKELYEFDAEKLDWAAFLLQYIYGIRKYALKEKGLIPPKKGDYFKRWESLSLGNSSFFSLSDLRFAIKGDLILNTKTRRRSTEEIKFLVLASDSVQSAIKNEAREFSLSISDVEAKAKEIVDVMEAKISAPLLRSLGWVFRKIYRKLYSGVVVNELGLEQVKKAFADDKEGKIAKILVPSHRTYIDFLIISYLFYTFQLPVPHIAAGDDFLNVMLVRWIFRHAGAFFMRRSFKNDELYRSIFTEYTQRLLLDGYPIEFFIEGTRSRSGKTLQPKMGLLSIVTEPFFAAKSTQSLPKKRTRRKKEPDEHLEDICFFPIAIAYEKVIEENAHIKELMGESKKKPSLKRLLLAAQWVLSLDLGRINVQFATPVYLNQFTSQLTSNNQGFNPFDDPHDRKYLVNELGYRITRDIESNTVCMSTGIVATLLLTHRNGITQQELVEKYKWLSRQVALRGGWVDPVLQQANFVVERALSMLGPLVGNRNNRLEPSIPTIDDQRNWLHLGYYGNQLSHIFKNEAIIACSLVSFGNEVIWAEDEQEIGTEPQDKKVRGILHDELFNNIHFLGNMLSFEFIPDDNELYENCISVLVREKVLQVDNGSSNINATSNLDNNHSGTVCNIEGTTIDSILNDSTEAVPPNNLNITASSNQVNLYNKNKANVLKRDSNSESTLQW
eukprot:CAMPEP_0174269562 /NCGR_PEP_ID=MMETSP0439-20130205/41507_1 /TAXON_ID=0 /ORGANISM="Stereomyxa ramosa, Strain Chinc5" /LENGTH=689 /DNA_ID=CAMNT_0015358411 /DNA_START=1180 /DNA_END=3246 /DNA_ORIENTATION=+